MHLIERNSFESEQLSIILPACLLAAISQITICPLANPTAAIFPSKEHPSALIAKFLSFGEYNTLTVCFSKSQEITSLVAYMTVLLLPQNVIGPTDPRVNPAISLKMPSLETFQILSPPSLHPETTKAPLGLTAKPL